MPATGIIGTQVNDAALRGGHAATFARGQITFRGGQDYAVAAAGQYQSVDVEGFNDQANFMVLQGDSLSKVTFRALVGGVEVDITGASGAHYALRFHGGYAPQNFTINNIAGGIEIGARAAVYNGLSAAGQALTAAAAAGGGAALSLKAGAVRFDTAHDYFVASASTLTSLNVAGFTKLGQFILLEGVDLRSSVYMEGVATSQLTITDEGGLNHVIKLDHTYAPGQILVQATPDGVEISISRGPPAPAIKTGLKLEGGYLMAAANTAGQVLTGTAARGEVVTVYDEDVPIGTTVADARTGVWSFTLGVLSEGPHRLYATATDPAGQTGPASQMFSFVVDTTAPPAPAGVSDRGVVGGVINTARDIASQNVLSGTAEPGSVIAVYDGTVKVGSAVAKDSGLWAVSLGKLKDGVHVLTATATDAAGNTSAASAPVRFTVDASAPHTSITDIVRPGAEGQVHIRGTTEAGSSLSVFDGDVLVGKATAGADGSWSLDAALPSAGVHRLTEVATDPAGNSSTSGVTVLGGPTARVVAGGLGQDTVIGRPGELLAGGDGADRFVIGPGFGKEMIADFTPAAVSASDHDVLQFDHAVFASYAAVMAAASQHGADVWIAHDPADVLVLKGVTLASLHAGDFVFV